MLSYVTSYYIMSRQVSDTKQRTTLHCIALHYIEISHHPAPGIVDLASMTHSAIMSFSPSASADKSHHIMSDHVISYNIISYHSLHWCYNPTMLYYAMLCYATLSFRTRIKMRLIHTKSPVT